MAVLETLTDPGVFPWACFALGLVVGSFLNVVIHRLPIMLKRDWRKQSIEVLQEWGEEQPALCTAIGPKGDVLRELATILPTRYNLLVPRSACPRCGRPIKALENIPLISYALLGGRCAACKGVISVRYPLIELFTGVVSALVGWHFGFSVATLAALIFAWSLIAAAVIDLDTQLLPDDITLPLIWIGLLFNIWGTFVDLPGAVIGATAGYLSLWSVYWLFKLATGKEGMGFGDFKLLAAIGAFLGWKLLPAVILLSSLVGAVVGIALILIAGRDRQIPIPFGPYLAAAGLLAMFFGERINHAYFQWL
ncbi:MAG TPA: A24 family peptidase [Burkholderiales bacterium]|nr:A24 family peptidase [Burkholderiales bacterium]